MDIHSTLKKIFERDIGKSVISIKKCENNIFNINNVFIVETGDLSYIFKLYRSFGYPEKDKARFVSEKLMENKIPHAKIISYAHSDEDFLNGYIIEEYLPGIPADRLLLTEEKTCDIYKNLALLTSKIHKINLTGCGFIIDGKPDCASLTEHIEENFIYGSHSINSVYTEDELGKIKQALIKKLKPCDHIQPCLCHIDIQLKNILVDGENIVLIDWDDARSFPAIVDIARLTLLIELAYDDPEAEDAEKAKLYKRAFLNNYASDDELKLYYEHETTLQVWHGLIILNFCDSTSRQYSKIKKCIDSKLNLFY